MLILILATLSGYSQINIRAHYMRGRQHLANHEFTQAIQYFNTILQYDPDHAEALFYRGLSKYQLSDYSGAEADFTQSVKIKPYTAINTIVSRPIAKENAAAAPAVVPKIHGVPRTSSVVQIKNIAISWTVW